VSERWREPIVPVKVEHDTEAYDVKANGEVMRAVRWTLRKEDLDRVRQGYACLNCLETFETPRRIGPCPVCSYNLEGTLFDLENVDRGGEHVGPATTLHDEVERVTEDSARRRFNKDAHILVPRAKA
jgi:hypothetical protein